MITSPTLQVYFKDNTDSFRDLVVATIQRESHHFTVKSAEEDIRCFLEGRTDTAYYFDHADGVASFRDILANIGNGVNKYSYAGYRIIQLA